MTEAEESSKSERKRQADALKKLGKKLCDLTNAQRAQVPLPDDLTRAIEDYHRFNSHGAQRRQLQFIGRLMRSIDTDTISAAIEALEQSGAEDTFQHHALESWRTRLLTEPDALTEYVTAHPQVDVQTLRTLIRQTRKARTETQNKTAARSLFRFLREVEGVAGDTTEGDPA